MDKFTKQDRFLMLALDHRQGFKKLIGDVSDGEVIQTKQEIIESLYVDFSAVLLDPEYGLAAYKKYVQNKIISPQKQYVLCCEKTGYTEEKGEKITELEYSVQDLKNRGAAGIKLLLYVNPYVDSFSKQREIARQILEKCKMLHVPLFLEFVTYSLDNSHTKSDLILTSVRNFLKEDVRADVFKVEFPEDAGSCKKLTEILGETAWILLTKGASFDQFKADLEIAVKNGCRGFLAGRSVWQEALGLRGEERKQFLNTVARKRFEEISAIALQS